MKTFRKYHEERGLGDIKPTMGMNDETVDELADLLRDHAESFRRILFKTLSSCSGEEEHHVKKLIGLIGNLREKPHEKKKRLRDPMDNMVVRQGPVDGSNTDVGGGGAGGES